MIAISKTMLGVMSFAPEWSAAPWEPMAPNLAAPPSIRFRKLTSFEFTNLILATFIHDVLRAYDTFLHHPLTPFVTPRRDTPVPHEQTTVLRGDDGIKVGQGDGVGVMLEAEGATHDASWTCSLGW
jgi:hypothetical protein